MSKSVKPKRPARKRTLKPNWEARFHWAVDGLFKAEEKLEAAEADKRILLDENLKLQEQYKQSQEARWSLFDEVINRGWMLDAVCHSLEVNSDGFEVLYSQNQRLGTERDTLRAEIETHDRIIAERDALAHKVKELEQPNRTKSMMEIEKW